MESNRKDEIMQQAEKISEDFLKEMQENTKLIKESYELNKERRDEKKKLDE